jgi:serine/threonine-protein kinase
VSDAAALDWLDRLLAADEPERRATLEALAGTDPELHARLQRLLAHALAPEDSKFIAAPVLAGVNQLSLDATRAMQPGDVLAGYRLIRELGRGGMSVVWLAERADGVVKRHVALKMPMFMLQGAGDVERFARERDALAALSHPNVARLYDAGVLPSGQPFIVLEHIDGQPLTGYCDVNRLDVQARLRLFLQVLGAVEHAHKHLVIHRDIKPSNILVNEEGQVKLLDFGIAKLLGQDDGAAALTQAVGAAMTPLYAAPEQLRPAPISTLTDVYALGVVLHELLTGALPYRGTAGRATFVEVLEAVGRGTLPRASHAGIDDAAAMARSASTATRLRRELSGDLDTIVGKALRVVPDERYGSAAHLADDLKRYLDRQPIAARPPSFWYSARMALKRHSLAAGVAGVGLTLVIGASLVAWMQYRESRAHAERTAVVRNFMFDLVNDAEAVEGQEGEVTGKQMIDGAVLRARREFGAQPQLQGELLAELGRMYIRLDAAEAATPVLEESVAVLEKFAQPDDPALNKARMYLADALLRTTDDRGRMRELAWKSREDCASREIECAKARAYASNMLSQLAGFDGDDRAALVEMRRSVVDSEFAFGSAHTETAMALMSLAITARNAGNLVEAEQAMKRAVAISSDLRLRASDRNSLERTMAVIDLDLGHYTAARDRLVELEKRPQPVDDRALLGRLLANVYVELGDAQAALRSADSALALLAGGEDAGAVAYLRQARARALALAGQFDAALAGIDEVTKQLRASGSAPESYEMLRALRYRAEFLLDAGYVTEALNLVRELAARHAGGGSSAIEHGLTLDLLGQAERAAGNPGAARAAHQAARVELAKQLPEEHPFLVRNNALYAIAKQ